jgi:acyl carrier protein
MGKLLTCEELTTLVQALLAEILECSPQGVPEEASLVDDLDLDSLQQLELMTRVEHELNLRLDIEDWRGGRTVRELAERVRLRLEQSVAE